MGAVTVAAKGDVSRLGSFEALGFSAAELYLRDEESLASFPETNIPICAVHQPGVVKLNGRQVGANLCDPGEAGQRSTEALAATVAYARRVGAPKVVIHPGYFDAFTTAREAALALLARRLRALWTPDVLVCIENIPLWSSSMHGNEASVARVGDFQLFLDLVDVPVGLVLDVEHFCLSTIVGEFHETFRERFGEAQGSPEAIERLQGEVDEAFHAYASAHQEEVVGILGKRLAECLDAIGDRLVHLHVCGTDYLNFGERNPRFGVHAGEHLPPRYSGLSGGLWVQDRIDHHLWISRLAGTFTGDVVIEINCRPEFDCLRELAKARDFLEDAFGLNGNAGRPR
jgi:sugar phosphate isomerase/epimerase